MNADLSNKVCTVVDDGQFVELAIRLSKEFGKVNYVNPNLIEGFPKAGKWAIGCGFDEIEWSEDVWSVKHETDLFVFPDVMNSGLQLELESQGKRVIGSRKADLLELKRISFKRIQDDLGMNVPVHTVIEGLEALRKHLKTVEDKWIKISRFRGSFETEHHINYELSQPWLWDLQVELGPLSEDMLFLVEDPIRGEVEFGYDGFCFDGRFPSLTLFGPEIKSKCYAGAVIRYNNLDERLRSVNELLSPELKQRRMRNFFSTEVRIAKDDEHFKDGAPVLIEPTCRIPSPPFESELQMYNNLGDILWNGSEGDLVEPEMADDYTVTVRITHSGSPKSWRPIQIPEQVREWFKLYDACKVGDVYWIVPKQSEAKRIGAMVGIGPTLEQAVEHCKANLELVKDQPIDSEIDSLVKAIQELEKAQSEGIEFGDSKLPEPSVILEDK